MILGCQNHNRKNEISEFPVYSISLHKSGEFNADLLTCCFETDQPSAFINKLKLYRISKVDFPMARQLGLDYASWKVKQYDLDSAYFVLGLFIKNFQISSLTNDSIAILTQKLRSHQNITIILENNDSIKLYKNDSKTSTNMKAIFSVNDTNWKGIDY